MKRILTTFACACITLSAWAAPQPPGEMEIQFLLQRDDELKNRKYVVISIRHDSDTQTTVLLQLNPPNGEHMACTFSLIDGQWRLIERSPIPSPADTPIISREPLDPASAPDTPIR